VFQEERFHGYGKLFVNHRWQQLHGAISENGYWHGATQTIAMVSVLITQLWPGLMAQSSNRASLTYFEPSTQFTKKIALKSEIHFWDVLVIRNPTHIGRYLNLKCNPPHVKRGLIQIIHKRASTTCQGQHDLFNEINLKCDLQFSGYPQGFIDSFINSWGSSHPNKEEISLGSAYTPYVMGIS
jgi:hypothetical protein